MAFERRKRIVTMCQGGNFRSTTLAYCLKSLDMEAVAIGHTFTGEALKEALFPWADHIIVVEQHMIEFIPPQFRQPNKLMVFEVGPDKWCQMNHPELMQLFRNHIKRVGWIQI